ncbi:UNVERIFIED_CONTAM: hypothetical protein GTU68_018756 [Idotea baltica]|nr:hypothetical protein [Idotea baltica]
MSPSHQAPEGQVADAVKGNWVDTLAPEWSRPYFRLSRADRPIGTWLLLLPCWWGLLLAMLHTGNMRGYDAWLFVACAAGAWLMRGAGCTWNDITDRDYDGQVERTRSRPIPSGQVSVRQALIWLVLQALVAFSILLTFPPIAILLGIASLIPVAIYPFAKRFTWWPQVFLGIAFNWGALLVWTAHTGSLSLTPVVLWFAGIAWTLFYDTIYAHQDTEDDALIGVKSTARLFGEDSARWLRRFLIATVVLLGCAVMNVSTTLSIAQIMCALLGVAAMGLHLSWQLSKLDIHDNDLLLRLFRSNKSAGLILVAFFATALFL